MAAAHDHAVEHVLRAVFQHQLEPGALRLDPCDPAVEPDAERQVEMRRILLKIPLHLDMVGI